MKTTGPPREEAPGSRPGASRSTTGKQQPHAKRNATPAQAKASQVARLRNLPAPVRAAKCFVVWRETIARTDTGKPAKIPHYVDTNTCRRGVQGDPADLAHMATFDAALALYQRDPTVAGIGIACLPSNPFTFVDIDNCYDPSTQTFNALAQELLDWNTYAEFSPSGKGLRLIVRGNLGLDAKNHELGLEVFSQSGFVTVTGRTLPSKTGLACPLAAPTDAQIRRLGDLVRRSETHAPAGATDGPADQRNIPSPLTKTNLAEVRAALKLIDSDLGYADWIKVGQALHSGDPDPNGLGFRTWVKWSKRGEKFTATSEEEMLAKWRGFHPGRGVTLATLFYLADKTAAEAEPEDGLIIVPATDIPIRNIRWLWPGRIPYGMLTLFAGEGGVGKGTVCAHLVACATGGLPWPDHDAVLGEILGPDGREPIDVLWFGVEDAPADVIIPRCIAAGTVRARLHFEQGVRAEGGTAPFNFADDLQRLEVALRRRPTVKLVIFDPITAYTGTRRRFVRKADTHNAGDLRGLLAPLAALAMRTGVALVGITHLIKAQERSFVQRVIGSGAWTQVARKVHAFCEIPNAARTANGAPEYAMLDVKGNVGAQAMPLRYRIGKAIAEATTPSDERVHTSRIEWTGADPTLTIEQLTGRSRGPVAVQRASAAEWLRERLANGPVAAGTVKTEARVAGYAEHTLRRAREEICEIVPVNGVTMYRLRASRAPI